MEEPIKAKRYIIYLRKSADDEGKQVRSIPDQRIDCLECARRNGIKVRDEDIIEEERSARRSNNRPLFSAVLEKIRTGEVDGLIAWGIDRLARNMKEGGEIIDLLDEEMLIDLKFASHHFVNDHHGKMSLGIQFVMAKQYTDILSVNVTRGMRRSFEEGKSSGAKKHGYVRNEKTGLYEPDETETAGGKTMFFLIKKAWDMRISGAPLDMIVEWLNDQGYYMKVKRSGAKQVMAKPKLSTLLKDTFYYGLLKQAGEEVNLSEIYNFAPMITEDEYFKAQLFGRGDAPKPKKHQFPFRGLLSCASCNHKLTAGAPMGRGKDQYIRYWCGQKTCNSKSIRAKAVIEKMCEVLDQLEINLKSHYKTYVEATREALKRNQGNLASKYAVLSKRKKTAQEELEKAIMQNVEHQEDKEILEKAKQKLRDTISDCDIRMARIKDELDSSNPLDVETFLNTLKTLSERLNAGTAKEKDTIAQNTFLNIVVDEGKITNLKLKEPFASMLKDSFVQSGGPGWT